MIYEVILWNLVSIR